MTNNIYLVSLIGSILFFTIKFFEARIVLKDKEQNIKQLIRDTILVYISIVGGSLIFDQLTYISGNVINLDSNILKGQAEIFTNDPPF
jgi:hypothetical protein